MIEAEAKRRNINLESPEGFFIKEGFLAQARANM
jgi:hypothetical protein